MKVSRVSEMRAMDQTAIEQFGISPDLLMENAGHAAYFTLRKEFGIDQKTFLTFCGLGNNGGDGFVLARKIHANGGRVQVMILGDPDKFQGPARTNYEILTRLPIELLALKDLEPAKTAIADCDIVIDAIFGTGLSRDVEGLYREVVELINASHKPVLSIDIPSGVHGDTGKVMGVAVQSKVTVTFGLPKLGNVLSPGCELGGKLFVSHISFPPSLHQSNSLKIEINRPPPPAPQDDKARKSTFGKVLTIGADPSDSDAPTISILSFLQKENDDPSRAITKPLDPLVADKDLEIMVTPQEEEALGSPSSVNDETLLEFVEGVDIVAFGPGLSHYEESLEPARELAKKITKPLLIDGKGLTAFCEDVEILQNRKGATILLPRLEEMSCITSKSRTEIDERMVDIVQETAAHLNSIIVFKGVPTLIGFPDRRLYINRNRISGRVPMDSSDVLTNTVAGMYCKGVPLDEAVRQGVFICGLAGELTLQTKGEDGITIENILDYLPLAHKIFREGLSQEMENRTIGIHTI